ncbi:MAG: AbrB/MazE/SpoVT family DNA-binding domain-containing protein [Acidobacteria bacterium]|nr:AbrB/MazE/SpoVT family DNA-binding domain-containing protein [Acidobacteriota bacterium]
MRTKIKKWGNSLAVRIPKSVAEDVRISQNVEVELQVRRGKIILLPIRPGQYDLEELLEAIKPEHLHKELDTGSPVGREVW